MIYICINFLISICMVISAFKNTTKVSSTNLLNWKPFLISKLVIHFNSRIIQSNRLSFNLISIIKSLIYVSEICLKQFIMNCWKKFSVNNIVGQLFFLSMIFIFSIKSTSASIIRPTDTDFWRTTPFSKFRLMEITSNRDKRFLYGNKK